MELALLRAEAGAGEDAVTLLNWWRSVGCYLRKLVNMFPEPQFKQGDSQGWIGSATDRENT